ncbi:MAG: DNA polymerase III subunit delta [Bacteroidota bacterium]|nr:DNA polymerase III subunit delta [Bacteroidota bacterium]
MTDRELARHIESRSFLPVYLLYGEEDFLIEQRANELRTAALGDGDPSFNYDVFRGTDHQAEDVTVAANGFPFMSEKRVVLVREADAFLKKPVLASYVQQPSPDTVLILCAASLKPSRRKKAPAKKTATADVLFTVNQMEKASPPLAAAVEYKALRDREAQEWITHELQRQGKRITPEACTIMHALRGNNTRELASEIDKLLTAIPDRQTLEPDDVYLHLGASKQYNAFALTNAIMARDGRAAHDILFHLLGTEEPLMLVSMIARQMTYLWQVRSLSIPARATDEHARSVGLIWGWQVENLNRYAKNFNDPVYFERCFEYILAADLAIKSGPIDPSVAVTRLVSELTQS